MDNFEWADGYGNWFGLHYMDYATQRRTLKLSAAFYREVIARNGVAQRQCVRFRGMPVAT